MFTSSINQKMWKKANRRDRILHVLKIGMSLVLFVSVIICIGSEVEQRLASKASDTLWAYETKKVCGHFGERTKKGNNGSNDAFTTYDTYDEAKEDDASVAHCGECGWCSTAQDINIIDKTKNTLTKTTTECAKLSIPFNRGMVEKCMDERVGFTEGCRNCWVDNIMCTLARCGFTCTKSVFLYNEATNVKGKHLNPCLECDEKMCGPNFIRCAGANRRRSGIISDIKRRDDEEVCQHVDEDWKEWLDVLYSIHENHYSKYSLHNDGDQPKPNEL